MVAVFGGCVWWLCVVVSVMAVCGGCVWWLCGGCVWWLCVVVCVVGIYTNIFLFTVFNKIVLRDNMIPAHVVVTTDVCVCVSMQVVCFNGDAPVRYHGDE